MMPIKTIFKACWAMGLAFGLTTLSEGAPAGEDPVGAELIADAAQVAPGDTVRVGVRLEVDEGWHIYGRDPGINGLPTEVTWDLPEGVVAGELRYPPTEVFEFQGERDLGYTGEVFLTATLRVPEDFEGPLPIGARVSWLACRDLCIPGERALELSVPVGEETILSEATSELFGEREEVAEAPAEGEEDAASTRRSQYPFWAYLVFGFIGGIILNVMPCVLPVIGLKFMGLAKHAGDSPKQIIAHAWIFTAGILVSLWVLAAIVVVLQSMGNLLGQGFQLANFPFLVVMSSVIFVLGLSMMGVFLIDLGTGVYQQADKVSRKSGYAGSFGNGVLVTLLATPCTAPVLGLAMGFAFIQPPWVTFLIFTAVGLGLAFPFILLGHFPGWIRFLPKPGVWMEYVKQVMGFVMMAAVVWLLSVMDDIRGGEVVLWMVAFLLMLALASWIYGTFARASAYRARMVARTLILVILVTGVTGILEARLDWRNPPERADAATERVDPDNWENGIPWVSFSRERLNELLEENDRPVFVNFTASWCISCKANERAVIDTESGREILRETGTIPVYADWTDMGREIAEFLREFNRAGVPLYLVYGEDRDNPQVLPEILTPGLLERALRSAAESFDEES